MDHARRALRGLLRDTRGTVAVITVLVMPIVAGFAGLAIDATYWYMVRVQLQTAVDAAAIGGAYELMNGNNSKVSVAAENDAVVNGFDSGAGTITVNVPPTSGPNVGDNGVVEVIISQPVSLFLSGVFLNGPVTVRVRGVANTQKVGESGCVIGLDPVRRDTIRFTGTTDQNLNCGVSSNSSDKKGLSGAGTSRVIGYLITVVGDFNVSGGGGGTTFSTKPLVDQPVVEDPYADLKVPTLVPCVPNGGFDCTLPLVDPTVPLDDIVDATACDFAGPIDLVTDPDTGVVTGTGKFTTVDVDVPTTFSPGVYCGGLSLSGNVDMFFNPGVYIIDGGDLRFTTGSVTGADVSFVLMASPENGFTMDDVGNFWVAASNDVDLSAPTSDPACPGSVVAGTCPELSGVLVFQDRNAPATEPGETGLINNKILGNSTTTWTGALYFPNRNLEFTGGNESASSGCTQLVARTLKFAGNAELKDDLCDTAGVRAIEMKLRKVTLVE